MIVQSPKPRQRDPHFARIAGRCIGFVAICACLSVLPASIFAQQKQDLHWYKGNLHTHSLWSDGDDFPEMIVKWYRDHDYQFLAITDHNVLQQGERWMALDKIAARGSDSAIKKYVAAMGQEWVEQRTRELPGKTEKESASKVDKPSQRPTSIREVRLKTMEEYRGKFEAPGEFLLLPGEEISDSVKGLPIHMNATNVQRVLKPAGGSTVRDTIQNNLRQVREQSERTGQPILIHLNHPNFGWAVTAEDLAWVTEEKFFEIYNGHPGINHLGDDQRPAVERMWDIANTIRIDKLSSEPLLGLGTDDCHDYHGQRGSQPGRGWIMVQASELTPQTLLKQIQAGNFYASSGVTLDHVKFDDASRTLELRIRPQPGVSFQTQIIGTLKDYDSTTVERKDNAGNALRATRVYSPDVGKTLETISGESVKYQLTGNELYVRAVITSSADHPNPSFKNQKQQAWTQPVGWELIK